MEVPGLISYNTKGELLGLCNRSACLKPGANYYNHSTRAHYCKKCADLINMHNYKDSMDMFGHVLCTEVVGIVEADDVKGILDDIENLDGKGYETIVIDSLSEKITNPYSGLNDSSLPFANPTRAQLNAAHKIYPVRTEPKISRNQPCPCHSGKKYKQCCLRS